MPDRTFEHKTHHHCESGAVTNLFNSYGMSLSEDMIFGIGAGLYFAYVPFLKTLGAPTTTFRYLPGKIFKTASRSLGVRCEVKTYKNAEKGMAALDGLLRSGKPVGLFTNMLHLSYLPDIFRFEFSAHNLIVYGKEGNDYLVSDPIIEFPVKISGPELAKARFGKGLLGSNGRMYHVQEFDPRIALEAAVQAGITTTCRRMLSKMYPWGGLTGMRRAARDIKRYPQKLSGEKVAFYLTNLVRMQEIVGTGGSGFRLIYARFLAEAATVLQRPALQLLSEELRDIAMDWRSFALKAGKAAKSKPEQQAEACLALGDMLLKIADREETVYQKLSRTV